ncbi:hypothetical protein CR513_61857, partial [Mucuna pruriens]
MVSMMIVAMSVLPSSTLSNDVDVFHAIELLNYHHEGRVAEKGIHMALNYMDKDSIPSSPLSLSYKRRRDQIERHRESEFSQSKDKREG